MADRAAKTELFEQYARVGKALSAPKRLELLDLLAQGERTVDALARTAGLGVSTASMHLQTLRQAGLVRTRKEGTSVHYRLAGDDVAGLYADLRDVALAHLADADRARVAYLGGDDAGEAEDVPREELLRRARSGQIVVLDVRPQPRVRLRAHPRRGVGAGRGARAAPGRAARRRPGGRVLPRRVLRARLRRGPVADPAWPVGATPA